VVKKSLAIILCLVSSCHIFGSDPTRPPSPDQPEITENLTPPNQIKQHLTGIFKRNGEYFAIIEGSPYKKGDFYKDYQIIQINSVGIKLGSNQGTLDIQLIPQVKK
jgi:hypothetical protein